MSEKPFDVDVCPEIAATGRRMKTTSIILAVLGLLAVLPTVSAAEP
jgi:hypothetical protein